MNLINGNKHGISFFILETNFLMENFKITHFERAESVNMLLFKPYSLNRTAVETFTI